MCVLYFSFIFFFFNDTATTEIYTLSLHDALPISIRSAPDSMNPYLSRCTTPSSQSVRGDAPIKMNNDAAGTVFVSPVWELDRKSTRLNSSHANISYAVFCLKKKKNE